MFQAIEIGGESYWDGGYSGNPTMTPLVRECTSKDTILVQINPVERQDTPRTARDILNRLNEVSFNSVLAEGTTYDCHAAAGRGSRRLRGALWAGMRIHRITSEALTELGSSSKLNAERDFLCMLRDQGRSSGSPSSRRMVRIWGGVPRSTSTFCWKAYDAVGLLGILLSLRLLVCTSNAPRCAAIPAIWVATSTVTRRSPR